MSRFSAALIVLRNGKFAEVWRFATIKKDGKEQAGTRVQARKSPNGDSGEEEHSQ
jgi:hypothetical protein